ncbi:hypothetical protein BpHYR1_054367 [Brachionus plicatilis]|uniref:Uncharacterized protein n=1 Tax=Brachionus plicatilis TaxID=10195 RepID=A0A3M7RDT2_BRAPC|nr:hypothetical protein BpHYR1_054367 [Brachionus plicatilis]
MIFKKSFCAKRFEIVLNANKGLPILCLFISIYTTCGSPILKTSTCQCVGNECMHGLACAQHAHRLLIQTSACNCTANRVHTQ